MLDSEHDRRISDYESFQVRMQFILCLVLLAGTAILCLWVPQGAWQLFPG